MDSITISAHQVKVFAACRRTVGSATAKHLAATAGVSRRTVAKHAAGFVDDGIFERQQLFPEHVYRFNHAGAQKRGADIARLMEAAEAMGIDVEA